MNVIDEVRKEREDLARVLKRHLGIRRIVEDLYPDKAHFIFELLQNAEDRSATEVSFSLMAGKLIFEHNGETFRPQDIYAITDIGEGTKADDHDKIGRFGVGFKAVFAYSETPHIWSPTFSFSISELVLPSPLSPVNDIQGKTRFEFPFNNPKKPVMDAFEEIRGGLNELAETTLLFLPNIESVKWRIGDSFNGEILRIAHSDAHVEVMKQINGQTTTSAHFLRFDQVVTGLEKQRVSIAFGLDFLPNVQTLSSTKPLAQLLKIMPVQGQVAVYFPANKEASGLRFHLHAPFVPELSRASIKSTTANNPLFDQLAALAVSALHEIRELGLLTTEFLGVLPNPQDRLGEGYGYVLIRDKIIQAMKAEPLFPTHGKGHASAITLVQAKASLKELLSHEDIEFLIEYEDEQPKWAANRALQGTNAERFMTGLEIREWDIEAFVDCIDEKSSEDGYQEVDPDFMSWLGLKSVEWHQQFYSLLDRESEAQDEIHRLKWCRIIRTADRTYAIGSACYFHGENGSTTAGVRYVDGGVYTSGKSKTQQESARKFLGSAGVTSVGERQLVEALLESSYCDGKRALVERDYLIDLRRFMKLLEEEPPFAATLSSFPLFMGTDNKWRKATEIYLDAPYLDTGLSDYFALGRVNQLSPLADFYQSLKIDTVKITRFVEKLGACTRLALKDVSCGNNPEWNYLSSVYGERYTSPINRDFVLERLSSMVAKKSERLAKLVWSTMCSLAETNLGDSTYSRNPLRAVYRKNERGGARFADSQLVHQLREEAWVPQKNGDFVKPAHARAELLPDGFIYDAGWPWIKAIQFGKGIQLQSQKTEAEAVATVERHHKEQEAAEALGFSNAETARKFAAMPVDEQNRALAEFERRRNVALPDHEPGNPERRRERIIAHSASAPGRRTEDRTRSVSIGRDEVKDEAKQYLRQQYTNADAEQICQICKDVLPFKLDDGSFYFETVELIPELKRHYDQNYLCLCANHAAMFKFANGSRAGLSQRISNHTENEVSVVLAQRDYALYFTKTHLADLKAIIQADQESGSDYPKAPSSFSVVGK
jgi:hypothetical protein